MKTRVQENKYSYCFGSLYYLYFLPGRLKAIPGFRKMSD